MMPKTKPYDSAPDTREHIAKVQSFIAEVRAELHRRGAVHDASKLGPHEKPTFDECTPKLRKLKYGSEKYKEAVAALGPALTHHYANNSHHPEHYDNGVAGMCLLDVVEMICDWRAAAERTAGGFTPETFAKSLEYNRDRYGLSDQMYSAVVNTCRRRQWITEADTARLLGAI